MYYPQEPKEPSGCLQTLAISRVILAILLVPILVILGAILAIMLAFYALTINPLLGLLVIAIGVGVLVLLARWESRRISRGTTRDDY